MTTLTGNHFVGRFHGLRYNLMVSATIFLNIHYGAEYLPLLTTSSFQVFKEPLEQSDEQRGGALLAPEEIKTIFGALPDLLDVHNQLLVSHSKILTFFGKFPLMITGKPLKYRSELRAFSFLEKKRKK